MKDEAFFERMKQSAQDFYKGVRPSIEAQFGAKIFPIEQLPRNPLINALDFVGVDAFIMDREKEMYGLGSRVNYAWFEKEPSFSFRYAIWDTRRKEWRFEREYQRKLEIANRSEKQVFPELHVESFSKQKGSGLISWAYMARTKDILNYINSNIIKDGERYKGKNGVTFKEPKTKESRLVVSVSVAVLKKVCTVKDIIIPI